MSREAILAAALTLVLGTALGGFLWWDAKMTQEQASAVPQMAQPGTQRPPPMASAKSDSYPPVHTPAPSGNALYRCEQGGRVTYQAEPCGRGARQSDVTQGSLSVIDGRAQLEQLARVQAMRPAQAPQQETMFGAIEVEKPQRRAAECRSLIEGIERIDALGRRPNTSQSMEWLRSTRRDLVERMHDLGCPRISAVVTGRR